MLNSRYVEVGSESQPGEQHPIYGFLRTWTGSLGAPFTPQPTDEDPFRQSYFAQETFSSEFGR